MRLTYKAAPRVDSTPPTASSATVETSDLTPDIWKLVADHVCVKIDKLRTVPGAARDLAALQQVCTSSTSCATEAWASLAKSCDTSAALVFGSKGVSVKKLDKIIRNSAEKALLERAVLLSSDQLTVFLQLQSDKRKYMYKKEAKAVYRLTEGDFADLKHQVVANPVNSSYKPARRYPKQVGPACC